MPLNIHARNPLGAAALAAAIAVSAGTARAQVCPRDPGDSTHLTRHHVGEGARLCPLVTAARVKGERFEVPGPSGWERFYIKGVNFGVAVPGHYPSEFPSDSALYAGWLASLASLGANTVRVYTILPPVFYRALRAWNIGHPRQILWLIHGVWAELPPDADFDDPEWKSDFQAEMQHAVAAVHGDVDIPPRAGHASGRYDADVSTWTLAYIIGREWEPYAVAAYDARHPQPQTVHGRFLELTSGTAMDAWLASECDFLLNYEATRYNQIRPIAYTNWPTLDPMAHPTEASRAEELGWQERAGRGGQPAKLEYDNDAMSLDASLIHPTARNSAGWFAAYHAYPYYPDFMVNDPGYNRARSSEGRSNYFGYLTALRARLAGIPLLIAEYGVPSSRGVAHLQPQGWNHGGHDEREMGAIDARLTREISEAGAAGGILFSWMDEWFKRNWLVTDFEIPGDHTPRWHNAMDAEQHYGLLGQYAGADSAALELGGRAAPWDSLQSLGDSGDGIRAGHDEAYVYLSLDAPGLDWRREGIEIGIDTYQRDVGQHRLPWADVTGTIGFEFVVDLVAPDSGTLRVTPEYNRYAPLTAEGKGDDFGRFYRSPVTTADRDDGRFDSLAVVTNRSRFGRDGTFFPAASVDRGRLRYGTGASSTLSDWYYDVQAGRLEMRIPWDLLNVTDPSSRALLVVPSGGAAGTVTADSFHFVAVRYGKRSHTVVWRSGPAAWTWTPWTDPTSHSRLKPAADSMRGAWQALP